MTPSGAVADTRKPGADRLDRLMVAAVDLAGVAADETIAHQLREERILLDPDLVRQVVRLVLRHRPGCDSSAPVTCDGMSCTSVPPRGDVQHLHAAADREDRQIARARRRNQADLELVARRIDVVQRLGAAVRHISPASTSPPPVSSRPSMPASASVDGHRRLDDADLAAGVENRLPVVFDLPARRKWQSAASELHPRWYFNPHQIQGASQLRAEVRHARPRATVSGRSAPP